MLDGVQGQAPGLLGRIVPQGIGHRPVAQLMERDAQQRGDHPHQHLLHASEIKAVPYFLQRVDSLHPHNTVILPKKEKKYKDETEKTVAFLYFSLPPVAGAPSVNV